MVYLKNTLKIPSPNRAIPMIIMIAPVTRLIQRMVLISNFFLKWLKNHDTQNQYVAEPALRERIIGITLQSCGALSAKPKNANNARITNTDPGFDNPIKRACMKSVTDTLEPEFFFTFLL